MVMIVMEIVYVQMVGVCDEFEIVGCQDPTASNYDPNQQIHHQMVAITVQLDFDFVNTGSNMTVFDNPAAGNGTIGVYYMIMMDNGNCLTWFKLQMVIYIPEKEFEERLCMEIEDNRMII